MSWLEEEIAKIQQGYTGYPQAYNTAMKQAEKYISKPWEQPTQKKWWELETPYRGAEVEKAYDLKQRLESEYGKPPVSEREMEQIVEGTLPLGEQYGKYSQWYGQTITKPFRGETPFKELPQYQQVLAEMAEPVMWFQPEAKMAKGVNVIKNVVTKGGVADDIVRELAKVKITGTEAERVINEVFENFAKYFPKKEQTQWAAKLGEATKKIRATVPKGVAKVEPEFKGLNKQMNKLIGEQKPSVLDRLKTIGKELLAIEKKPEVPDKLTPNAKPFATQLIDFINGAARLAREEAEMMAHQARVRRITAFRGVRRATGTTAEGGFEKATSKLAGEYPKPEFQPPKDSLPDNVRQVLEDEVWRSDWLDFQIKDTIDGLRKIWDGEIPQQHELALIGKFFGQDMVRAVVKKMPFSSKAQQAILDILNLPRAALASIDQSAILRQAALLTWGHPVEASKSTLKALKATVYSKWANEIDDIMKADPLYPYFREKGGYIAEITENVRLSRMEEQFMSKIARYLPGVRQSERGYVTYLNQMRLNIFKQQIKNIERLGINPDNVNIKNFTKLMNLATGRGTLPGEGLNKVSDMGAFLNGMFFSPRLLLSRIQLPKHYLDLIIQSVKPVKVPKGATEGVQQALLKRAYEQRQVARIALKEATRDIAAFVGATSTILGLAKLAFKDDISVETDPRSSDVGKLRVGNTRLDPWAGFQQYIKLLAQMATGERKTTTTGAIVPANRSDVLQFFGATKLAPAFGNALDILRGRNIVGEEIEYTASGVQEQTFKRMVSLFIQDMKDAYDEQGLLGLAITTPAFFGWGAQSYPDKLALKQAEIGTPIQKSDGTYDIYTVSNFGGDINRLGGGKGEKGSALVQFYFDAKDKLEKYNNLSTEGSTRQDFRDKNPETDALLFFWGRTGVLRSTQAETYVRKWLRQYGLSESALSNPIKRAEVGTTKTTPAKRYGGGDWLSESLSK